MSVAAFPEPDQEGDPRVLVGRLLGFYRSTVLASVRSLPETDRRRSPVPSGWSPLELLSHLLHVEQRWVGWGFLGDQVEEPWGDEDDGRTRWSVPASVGLEDLAAAWASVADRTEAVLATTPLDALAATGGRFEDDPPSLGAICVHLLQEVARHAGQLDVVVEMLGGPTGE